ncbi:MAG: TolC family protein [Polyangiaceae bacterium]|nr:TolC family protein [Polyangiaceae bacterium]
MHPLRRKLLTFFAIVLAGALITAWIQYSGDAPARRPSRERGRAARVLEVKPLEVIPRVTGYGVVQAQRSWQGIAEVGGSIVEMGENVEVGRTVQEGTLLFKIDPGTYKLEKSRTEATVRGVRAQIDELRAREASAKKNLELEKKALELARKDLERARKSLEGGVATATEVDTAERGVIAAEKAVQSLENTLLELPASRRVLEAQIDQQQAGVEGARISLTKTEVVAPFTMRIRQVNASLQQAISPGSVIVIGDGIDVMEVAAQFPVGTIGSLLGPRPAAANAADAGAPPDDAGAPPADAGADANNAAPRARRSSAITAIIRLKSQGVEATWNGKFRRFQGVDPATRTMGVVVEVIDARRREGRTGPPLSVGLHAEVELRGPARKGCLAIPRTALQRDKVHVVTKENRLEIRTVETDLLQEQYACITKGVKEGEQVILTSLSPAVEGMLIAPRKDDTAATWLSAAAKAEEPAP